ncbi:MAG: hypothetical protein LBT50_08675 [Prevotellaceae bacterium]|nr:hypothetical protein [Prevotellaceae bacterium]
MARMHEVLARMHEVLTLGDDNFGKKRHCERSEAIQDVQRTIDFWIASLRSQ